MDKLSEEQKERLMQAGQAAMNMSHGIKNIAQALRSGQEVMDKALQTGDIERARRTWNILKQSLSRLEKLSLNMLKFSKDEPLAMEACSLNQLVESVVKMIRPQANLQHIEISVQTDKQLKQMSLDPEKMRDVIMNLIINAMEVVSPQTGIISIEAQLDQQNNQAVLSVCDNGPGFEDSNVIFEPFYSTKDHVGAGLGLTIARRIIEKHRGTLTAHSQPGKGATFEVRIPV